MIIPAYFHEAGVPKTGLSPTIDIYRVSDNALVVNDGAMTAVGGGFYKYDFATHDAAEDYLYVCDGTATLANAYRYLPGSTDSQAKDALVLNNLDHLMKVAVVNGVNMTAEVPDGTVLSFLMAGGDTSRYDYVFDAWDVIGATFYLIKDTVDAIDGYLDTELAAITAAVITNAAGLDIAADIIALKAETVLILEDTGTTLPTAIADIPTVAEFEARTIVAANYLVEGDTLARVTLVDTCTVNSDMRGTNSAALASVCTEARLAELDAANLPADIDGIKSKTTNLPSDPADQSAVEAAITAATSPLATALAVADLPTNSELATALAAADDAVLAAIVALNNLSSAGAQAAAAAALLAYGVALQTSVDDLETRLTAARAGYLDNLSAGAVATAASVAALPTTVQINAEVVDALNVDTYAEPGQEAPDATVSLAKKISYLYKSWLNKKTQDATDWKLYNNAGAVADQKATVSEAGGTVTKGKVGTGA